MTVIDPVGVAGVATERLEAELLELAGHLAVGEARWLVLLGEFDRREAWRSWGAQNCAQWLGWRLGIARHTATEKLRVAHALRALSVITAAFSAGEVSYSQVRAITRVAGPHNEEAMLACAKGLTAAQLEAVVSATADADRNTRGERAKAQFERRGYKRSRDHHSGLWISRFALLPDQGVLVERALDRIADRLAAEQGDEVPATRGQLLADALVAMAETMLAGGELGHLRASAAFHAVIHADEPVLDPSVPAGTDAPRSHLELARYGSGQLDSPSITAETVRRICCDTTMRRVVEVDGKTVVRVDATQTIPAWVRRAVKIRDKTCIFPGCTSTRIDVHHLRYRSQQGTHDLANLAQLCRYHHTLCHEGGHRAQRIDGHVRFYDPNGRELRRGTHTTTGSIDRLHASHGTPITPDTATTYLEAASTSPTSSAASPKPAHHPTHPVPAEAGHTTTTMNGNPS